MRKMIVPKVDANSTSTAREWLDIPALARVELTSEDSAFPFESAVDGSNGSGWRAAASGRQTLRLLFDAPQRVAAIDLEFEEVEFSRTHEFALRWSADGGRTFREIVRQQFNFAPPDVTVERETYTVDLAGVTVLELVIVPDISGGAARAGVRAWRLA
ncbi:MAG: hypothetical protein ACFCUG_02155 [Thiotrichales bacterium]